MSEKDALRVQRGHAGWLEEYYMLVVMALAAPVMVWLFMQVRAQQMNAGWFVFGTAAAIFGAHLLLWPIVAYRKGCYSMADREQQRSLRAQLTMGPYMPMVLLLIIALSIWIGTTVIPEVLP